MSKNPYMDFQDQFFKMWTDNMDKMMDSEAYKEYKEMAKNVPGAEAYMKAMEQMVPNVENYWKTMAASMPTMPGMPNNPFANYWKDMAEKVSADQFIEYWKEVADKMSPEAFMDYWKAMTEKLPSNPFMDYYKDMAEKMSPEAFMDYWKDMANKMPGYEEYMKAYQAMVPGMQNAWDDFAKMMPNPEKFAAMAQFKMPGFEAFSKVFDLWKSFGNPDAFVADFQNKYMTAIGEIIKGLFPDAVQPFVARPVDYMNIMVEYYKQFVSPWMQIDEDIMKKLAEGDIDAYEDFFKDYMKKYEEELEKYFTILGFGLNREANEDYMATINQWNKAMISMGELLAVITKTAKESFDKIGEQVQKDLEEGKTITTFKDFYKEWYTATEDAYEKLLATDEFAKVFDDFADRYAQYMIAQNKVYERMLSTLPIPTNTDMKSLYKTVYDLRKEVRALKKEVAAQKKATTTKKSK